MKPVRDHPRRSLDHLKNKMQLMKQIKLAADLGERDAANKALKGPTYTRYEGREKSQDGSEWTHVNCPGTARRTHLKKYFNPLTDERSSPEAWKRVVEFNDRIVPV